MKDKLVKHHHRRYGYSIKKAFIVGLLVVSGLTATTVPFSIALTSLYSQQNAKNTSQVQNREAAVEQESINLTESL